MHLGEGIYTACTADEYLSVIFAIEVDESLPVQHTLFQFEGSGESCLFVHGE